MKFAAKLVATFFFLGYCPLVPGTVASLVAALIYFFWLHAVPVPIYGVLVLGLTAAAIASSSVQARAMNLRDPRIIVVDEVCGQFVALSLVPALPVNVLAGFVLFRIFDILKPFSIRRLERLPGGWGIVVDDLAAGACSAILLQAFFFIRDARFT